MTQLSLFSDCQSEVFFDGRTYEHDRDKDRLRAQYNRVFNLMADGKWRSLEAIARLTGDPEASVSARLRDMRKERFGSHGVERRYVTKGLFEYRLLVNMGEASVLDASGCAGVRCSVERSTKSLFDTSNARVTP